MGILALKLSNKKITTNISFDEIQRRILSVSNPDRIIIFGSLAKNLQRELSDLDIAVIFNSEGEMIKQKKIILNSKLFLDISVDFLFYTKEIFLFKSQIGGVAFEIHNSGVIIYDKESVV